MTYVAQHERKDDIAAVRKSSQRMRTPMRNGAQRDSADALAA